MAVDLIRRPRNAPVVNRVWKPEELETALTEAPPWLQVPIALGAYIGLRRSDVVRVTWTCYDGTAFEVRQNKTGNAVWIPVHSRLRDILNGAARTSPVIVVGARGRPFTQDGFQTVFFRFIRQLREAGKIAPGLSFHGLRHTLATRLAEAGCAPGTIAAVLGQRTTAMAEHYSKEADRRQLAGAAIAQLERKADENGKPIGKLSPSPLITRG